MISTVLEFLRTIRSLAVAVACVAAIGLAGCQSTASVGEGERAATKAEIEAVAVGKTLGARQYGADGSYRFRGGNPGRYRISDGRICVQFASGGSRCDRIVTDGSEMTLINAQGQRYPFAG